MIPEGWLLIPAKEEFCYLAGIKTGSVSIILQGQISIGSASMKLSDQLGL